MEDEAKKSTSGRRTSVGRAIKKTAPAPLPPEASARVSAAAAAAGAVGQPAAQAKPAPTTVKPAGPVMARPVPPPPKIAPPTVVPVITVRKVEMSFDAPLAKFVNIAGDFNAWEMTTLAMRKTDSVWKITLELKPGAYQYKFLADGEWVNDPNNVRTVPNQFGSLNNVLEVR